MVSRKTVGRLSVYRRLLLTLQEAGADHVYSHQLARLAGVTAAQVRRDLMSIGYSGSPNRGYEVDKCLASVAHFLDGPERQDAVLVGVGRLGRALLAHVTGRRPKLRIAACFDTDPELVGTSVEGCRCHSVDDMEETVRRLGARIGVIAVPADRAQGAAATLVAAGVRSIISFAPVPLRVPGDVFIDYIDITSVLESAAFFARVGAGDQTAEAAVEAESAYEGLGGMLKQLASLLVGAHMKLEDLADRIGARIVTAGKPGGTEIENIYAGDRVSDLLNEASDSTLLVSNLASVQLLRVAELMDVPGICFVDDIDPDTEIVDLAVANATLLMVSPVGVYETCGRIYSVLTAAEQAAAQA
jgi:redox-sensing transcriptional repressor